MIDDAQVENPDLDVKLLINRKIPGTRVGREARDSLSIFDMDLMDTELCQRVAYIDAMTSGVSVMQYAPSSKAANEIENLCDEITLEETEEESQAQEPYQYTQQNDVYGDKPAWKIYPANHLEAISKIGFWFKIAAGPSFKPQAYGCMSRI